MAGCCPSLTSRTSPQVTPTTATARHDLDLQFCLQEHQPGFLSSLCAPSQCWPHLYQQSRLSFQQGPAETTIIADQSVSLFLCLCSPAGVLGIRLFMPGVVVVGGTGAGAGLSLLLSSCQLWSLLLPSLVGRLAAAPSGKSLSSPPSDCGPNYQSIVN